MQYSVLKEKGWLEKDVDANLDLFAEIRKLKKEKNAIILAHYYQDSDIQDCADYIGDSLGLSQEAAKTNAAIIVFAGVHFMAETAKILSPSKKVLLPDLRAGCSLADSCSPEKFETFIKSHPEHIVISYVNCSAEVKALTDIVVTSSNAEKIVNSLPKNKKIIFAPDKNLGTWISKKTGRDMVLWNGSCMVHELFSLGQLIRVKEKNPNAQVIAHPECETAVLEQADFIGSTTALLNYTIKSKVQEFIVVTEAGILHQMQKASPEKTFIPAAPSTNCACNDCPHMKLNTLEKLYVCLKYEQPEVSMSVELMNRARKPIVRMLELSAILIFCLFFRSMLFSRQQEPVQNGYTKFLYDNGTVSSEGTMKDGKPDGYWKTYFDNGKIKSEGNRKNFQLDSTWKFYNDQGILVLEYYYKNGKKNGNRKNYDAKEKYLLSEENYVNDVKQNNTYFFYKNGKIKQQIPFKDGREEGQGYEYDTIGTIITLIDYKAGFVKRQEKINRRDKDGLKQNVWKEFYPNGNLKNECTWLNGIQNGYLKEYSLNGNLQNTTKYVDGKLIADAPELAKLDTKIEYYEGGIVKSSGTSKNGIPEGAYREFSIDGKVTASKIYKEGFLIGEGIYDENNKEQGPWKEYHPNGQLKGQGEYKDGKRIGEWVFYYPNGKLEQKGKYDKKGLAQNEWKWYYDSGKLLRDEIYLNDVLDGPTTEYDEEGKVITKGQYVDGMKEDEWEYELGDYKETGKYKADRRDGVWKHFYTPSGKIRFEGNFVDGNQDGKHVYYYQNGKVSEQGKYIVGRKEGNWEYFNEEGVKQLTILYQDDVELKFDGVKVKPTQEETDKPDKK